jgi:predicted RNase H-like HicB family nuclease
VISDRTIENIEMLVIQLINMQKLKIFTAVLHKEEDMYVAECPEVGTFSQGRTIEETVENLKEATELYLDEFPIENEFRSIITTFEVTSIAEA